MQPGALDRERADPCIAFDQAAQQRLDPAFGQLEHPCGPIAAGRIGEGGAPGTVLILRFQPHLRRQAVARDLYRPGIGHLAPRDDRDIAAQAFGVVDHVGREDHRRAVFRQLADQPFELALVDRIEPGERLVQNHQLGPMHQRAEQLHRLRHAFAQFLNLLVDRVAEAVLFHQFDTTAATFEARETAQASHEGDCVGRFHRRVEPAFLGQVADPARDSLRAIFAEDAADALVGVDNAEDHPQCGRLARTIGAEDAVDRAARHGQVHAVHRQRAAEPFYQAARLDCVIG